jgi:TetR/AcrR family transcriptional repressor of bet genes
MPRKSNTEERRAAIVRALLAAIGEHGYDKATIQMIARHAGLAPGLIHYHFENKREILVALMKTMAQFASARFDSLARDAATPREKLDAYLRSRLGMGDGANPEVVSAWVMIGAEAVREPEVRELYSAIIAGEIALVRRLISACLSDQGRRTRRATDLAVGLLAFMEGAFQLSSAARDVMPVGYAYPMAAQLAERFILAEPLEVGKRKAASKARHKA